MTIRYRLTRSELVLAFFRSMANSRVATAVIAYALLAGVYSILVRGAWPPGVRDLLIALAWCCLGAKLMPVLLFLGAKTDERVLTISPVGIATEIGTRKGEVAWSKVKSVETAGGHIVIVGTTGNAFFIPGRTFRGEGERELFLKKIEDWWRG